MLPLENFRKDFFWYGNRKTKFVHRRLKTWYYKIPVLLSILASLFFNSNYFLLHSLYCFVDIQKPLRSFSLPLKEVLPVFVLARLQLWFRISKKDCTVNGWNESVLLSRVVLYIVKIYLEFIFGIISINFLLYLRIVIITNTEAQKTRSLSIISEQSLVLCSCWTWRHDIRKPNWLYNLNTLCRNISQSMSKHLKFVLVTAFWRLSGNWK